MDTLTQPRKSGALGSFVNTQRKNYMRLLEGKLTEGMTHERAKELEALGFKWSIRNHTWDERITQLKAYRDQNGHCNVPAKRGQLGIFVTKQRKCYKLLREGKPANGMTNERVKELEGLGFKCTIDLPTWDERFEELKNYRLEDLKT